MSPADPDRQESLVFQGVEKRFGGGKQPEITALEAINLTLDAGRITALVGPDGAGKTTLLRLAAGLLTPTSGNIRLFGVDTAEESRDRELARARLGYMPQKFGLYEDLTVRENLELYADLRGLPVDGREERYAELLSMTGLTPFPDRLAGKLSGGMKQKLGLICTLVKAPDLLLLDEPTVGVDPLSRRELWEIVETLTSQSRMAVLVSTSYLDEAARCEEILLLFEGRALAQGTPDDLRARTKGMAFCVQAPQGEAPRLLQARLFDSPGVVDAVPQGGFVRLVHGNLDPAQDAALRQRLGNSAVSPAESSLEDTFMLLLRSQKQDAESSRPGERAMDGTAPGSAHGNQSSSVEAPVPPNEPEPDASPPWAIPAREPSPAGTEEPVSASGNTVHGGDPAGGGPSASHGPDRPVKAVPLSGRSEMENARHGTSADRSASAHPDRPADPDAASPSGKTTATGGPVPDGPAIETRNVTRKFGDFVAVNNVSFTVERGEVFGLLGPNGAGKTTTFRMLCGLLPASSGTLFVAGVDVRRAREDARRRLGYVAQKFSLYGQLTVMENLTFFAGAYGLRGRRRQDRIREVLRDFSLQGHEDMAAEDLPGGYKQRLAMAVGLLHEPQILFLDEPTSGADPLARREFWQRISALSAQGVTIVVTTHFMEEAEYCDRILIQDHGNMLALDTPSNIRKQAGDSPSMEDAFIAIVEKARQEKAPEEDTRAA